MSTAPWLQVWAGARQIEAVVNAQPPVTTVSDHRRLSAPNIPLLCRLQAPSARAADWAGIDLHSDVFNQFMEPFPLQL